jgi:hypothetical protein
MSVSLNSACNCCDEIPRFDFSELLPDLSIDFYPFEIRSRTKSVAVSACGVQNPDDGFYYKMYVETYEIGSITRTYTYDPVTNNCIEEIISDLPEGGGEGELQSVEYSEQVTPEELIGYAETRLSQVEYSEWNETINPVASRYSDFSGAAITVSEVQAFHPPTFSGFFKMWIDGVNFTWDPDQGFINPQSDPYDTYEWSGGLQSMSHSVNAEENRIYGPTFNLTAPNQTQIILYISKFSFLPDYVPNDPNIDVESGFPVITRPDPDCFSNGVPTVNASCPANLFI